MFTKILVANRGEIAVRIARACHDMGIRVVAVYTEADRESLHVRLADEAVPLPARQDYGDEEAILAAARQTDADAIHPGYGFLANRPEFARACDEAGVVFIGPSAEIMERVQDKTAALEKARAAGFPTPEHSSRAYDADELGELRAEAERLGYPVVIKSHCGGRGRGTRLASSPESLTEVVNRARAEAQAVYGDRRLYIERAILPAHQVAVQILADRYGSVVHLGERDGSIQNGNRRLVEESPAPYLSSLQREQLTRAAVDIVALFGYRGLGSVEFVVDASGSFYFTELKARIQIDHPIVEMRARLDLVQEQIRLAAGMKLSRRQADIHLTGWAMQCRIYALDPWEGCLPSPGVVHDLRLPGGPEVRVDTYIHEGAAVSEQYDPMLAKLTVWAEERDACLRRLQRAVHDFKLMGISTNLPLLERILVDPRYARAEYTTGYIEEPEHFLRAGDSTASLRDLAIAAAVAYARRYISMQTTQPERLRTGWHRASRQLPE